MKFVIELGNVKIGFVASEDIVKVLERYYYNFKSNLSDADYYIYIKKMESPLQNGIYCKDDCYNIVYNNQFNPSEYISVYINLKNKYSIIYYDILSDILENRFNWEFNFRVAIYIYMLYNNQVLIHAAGIAKDNMGYLFLGASGAGKTTAARNSLKSHFSILNDDTMIIYKYKENYYIASTPYLSTSGIKPINRTVLLKSLFL